MTFATDANLSQYDLVHGFFLPPDYIRRCRIARIPVVLSSIYWSRSCNIGGSILQKARHVRGRLRIAMVLAASSLRGRHIAKCDAFVEELTYLRTAFELADLLLPNSKAEELAIRRELGVTTPCHVVPNAVDPLSFNVDHYNGSIHENDSRTGVLYVGRFEPHKNQLEFIRAMLKSDLHALLVGPPHRDHPDYYSACQSLAASSRGVFNCRIPWNTPNSPHSIVPQRFTPCQVGQKLPVWFLWKLHSVDVTL